MSKWVPWLCREDGTKAMKLDLGKTFYKKEEITDFFTHMGKTHPHLVGSKITFELTPDRET